MVEALTSPILIWFFVGLVLIISEFAVPGIVMIFFGAGAWVVSAMCAVFDPSITVQLGVFLVSSVLSLGLLRSKLQDVFVGRAEDGDSDTLSEEVQGETALVTHKIEPHIPGKVEFRGTQWKAAADCSIEENQVVTIVRQENITLFVKPLKNH